MTRLTLADAQASRIPKAIGTIPTAQKFIDMLNEAQERLLHKGLWWGTYGKFKIAAYDGTLTMPPELATIETAAVSHIPVAVHDLWYEFLDMGFGTRSPDTVGTAAGSSLDGSHGVTGIPEATYRGNFPVFRDMTHNSNPKKIVLVCDLATDATKTVTVLGYDANNNWVRTSTGGVYSDGETIALAQSPGTTSTNTFSRITGVRFNSARSGQAWLYELDTVTSVQTLTGWYQWWESNPSYGRWLFPQIRPVNTTCTPPAAWQQTWSDNRLPDPSGTCNPILVEIIGKIDYRPVVQTTDYLTIQSIPALKFMCQALKKEEVGISVADVQEAVGYESMAVVELDNQLDHYLGSGRRMGMNIMGSTGDGDPQEIFV